MSQLQTDAELLALLPSLTKDEKSKLEISLKTYGCRENIIIWKNHNTIIDGHNRFEICSKNQISFEKTELSFETKEDVKLWMLRNQLSRRNINAFHRTRAQLLINTLEKDSGISDNDEESSKEEKSGEAKSKKKSEEFNEIAQQIGVSADTVRKVKFLEDNVSNDVKKKLMNGETTISKEYQSLRDKQPKTEVQIVEKYLPKITLDSAQKFLDHEIQADNKYDLLLTEPPSFNEWNEGSIDKYLEFYKEWLHKAIKVLATTARAFIFIDSDALILNQLINLAVELSDANIKFEDMLIWTFRPSAEDSNEKEFTQNWQAVLYFKGSQAPPLRSQRDLHSILHFVKDHTNDFKNKDWRKPIFLIKRLIQLSLKNGQKLIDPFAGSGQFLLAAARSKVQAFGSENHKELFDIAIENGCVNWEVGTSQKNIF